MKPLILMLLAATFASAQEATPTPPTPSLADYARQERARQREVQGKNIKVYTTEDIRTTVPDPSVTGEPATQVAPAATVAPPASTATAVPTELKPTPPPVDPAVQWQADTEKLRALIRELIDREATNQLEINRVTNEVYKPDTNETARDRARADLAGAQQQLSATRELLAKSRLELQQREFEGPPKKQ
jgi:hypothetical protein